MKLPRSENQSDGWAQTIDALQSCCSGVNRSRYFRRHFGTIYSSEHTRILCPSNFTPNSDVCTCAPRDVHENVPSGVSRNVPINLKQPKCPSIVEWVHFGKSMQWTSIKS